MNQWNEKFFALVAEFMMEEHDEPDVKKVIGITEYQELIDGDCDCCKHYQNFVDIKYLDSTGSLREMTIFGDMTDFLETFLGS